MVYVRLALEIPNAETVEQANAAIAKVLRSIPGPTWTVTYQTASTEKRERQPRKK